MDQFLAKALEAVNGSEPAALCIVVDTRGSTPRKQGARMIVYAGGTVYGTIGGGSVEKEVTETALKLMPAGKPAKVSFKLEEDLGMHCGGMMEVYIEPLNPAKKLFIFGAGHIGKALSGFARDLGFSVTLIDPREGIFGDKAFEGHTCINRDYFEAIGETRFDDNSYLVIVTPKHQYDEEILAAVARKPHAYLGMIGSSRKVDMVKKRFLDENILTPGELEGIDMPIGIRFRAETPQEIAISILARLIDVRNTVTV